MSAGSVDCLVRPAGPTDLQALCALEMAAASAPAPWSRVQLADSLAQHRVLLAERAGSLLGYAVFRELCDEAELFNILVSPEARRQGIGRLLLHALIAALGQARCLHLEVRAGNAAAIALYEGEGFARVGLRRGYYPADAGREDAVLMRLDLG